MVKNPMQAGTYETAILKDLKKGEFFRVSLSDNGKVYTKAEYDRTEKKYLCIDNNDIWGAGAYFKGTKKVYVGFTY